jgi:hypothetical protein
VYSHTTESTGFGGFRARAFLKDKGKGIKDENGKDVIVGGEVPCSWSGQNVLVLGKKPCRAS